MSQKIQKSFSFKKSEFWKYLFVAKKKKKNTILLVLPFEEISIRPELSNP